MLLLFPICKSIFGIDFQGENGKEEREREREEMGADLGHGEPFFYNKPALKHGFF